MQLGVIEVQKSKSVIMAVGIVSAIFVFRIVRASIGVIVTPILPFNTFAATVVGYYFCPSSTMVMIWTFPRISIYDVWHGLLPIG